MNEITPRPAKEISPWHIQRLHEAEEPGFVYASETETRHLRDYWNILIRYRRLVVLVFLVVFGISAFMNFSATPLYTASAMLQIEPQNPAVTGLVEILSSKSEGSSQYDYYQTQFTLLKSRALAARVITSLGLASNPTFNMSKMSDSLVNRIMPWLFRALQPFITYGTRLIGPAPAHKDMSQSVSNAANSGVDPFLVSRYLSLLKVTPVKNTRLVEVSFSTPAPHLSQKLADAHAAGFIRMNLDTRSTLTEEAREFLDKKNAELKDKLEQSEASLNRFRQEHGVVSLEKGENTVVDRLVALNGQLTTARAQRIEAESLYRTVQNKKYQDLPQVMTQGSIQQLKGNLATLEAERARLSTIFKPDHPRLQELNEHINDARSRLNSEIANVVRGIESNYVAARAKEEDLEAEAKKQEQAALNLKHIGVEYAVLQEEVNVNRTLYESVLKRLSETNVSNDLAISNIQITQRAELPLFPSSPETARNLLVAAAVGIFLGAGLAFFLEYLDTKLRTPEHIERAVSLNTLGVVPDLNSLGKLSFGWNQRDRSPLKTLKKLTPPCLRATNSSSKELLITKHHPLSVFPESYRTIRTSLLFSRAERPPQIILLTSASPREGKTGTSLNLGIALAQDGHRVLVIDADLRKGCCHDRLGMKNHKGLSNILTGNLALEEGLQATPITGLSLLSRGVCPPNPADLLGSNKMREVLTRLRGSYDFILIDSPPAIALSDAAVLSVMSDGVVLVIHGQMTTTNSAQTAVERLGMLHAPLLGVVLNGVDLKNPHYSYYRTYSSYYAYEPDGHEGLDETNHNDPDKAVHKFYNLSKIAQMWSKKEHPKATDTTADNDSVEGDWANGWQSATGVRSAEEIDEPDVLEPVNTGSTDVAKEPSSEDDHRATQLSEESLNRLIEALAKAIGPIAPLIIREQITILGESRYAFPKKRIGELLKSIQGEITQDELVRFKLSIPEEIRNIDNQ